MAESPDLEQVLLEELGEVGNFAADELAYLATTTKIELQVRDCSAWRLHQRL